MLVHVYFKENSKYKMRMFLNPKALFKDPIKELEIVIDEYESENNCSLGDNRELKALNMPKSYLNNKGIQIIEEELTDEKLIEQIINSQPVVEIL